MGKTMVANRRRRRKAQSFNPNSAYIEKAVAYYLKSGGKITKRVPDEESFKAFVSMGDSLAVSDFLNEGC